MHLLFPVSDAVASGARLTLERPLPSTSVGQFWRINDSFQMQTPGPGSTPRPTFSSAELPSLDSSSHRGRSCTARDSPTTQSLPEPLRPADSKPAYPASLVPSYGNCNKPFAGSSGLSTDSTGNRLLVCWPCFI